MQYPVKGSYVDNGLSSCQPTANRVAMKTQKKLTVRNNLTQGQILGEKMSAKHGCTSTAASVDSTSRPTDFSAYLYPLCAKMQAKLTVREVKVFNCWGLHPLTSAVNPTGASNPRLPSSSSSFSESAPDLAVMKKTSPFNGEVFSKAKD